MFKQIARFFLLFVCFYAFKGFSQITVSPTVGCVPLVGVSYSGPPGATGITWNFGDGVTSNQANPTHNYTGTGTFVVTFNATVGGSPVTYTAQVKVFPKPTANFSFVQAASGCAPKTATFTNLSTGGGGSAITGVQWSFGDGGALNIPPGSTATCNYVYTTPGSFTPQVTVTDANGCSNFFSLGTIKVSAPPTVIISSNPSPPTSCQVPFTATFSGSNCVTGSPIGGALTYSWNLGNSQTSTQQTPPSVTYTAQGNYNVVLTVTDNNNCSNSATVPVTVSQPSVNAVIPGTVCIGTPLYITDNSNVPITFWNMGDGASYPVITSPGSQTVHIYNTPGVYTISVSATSGTCAAVYTKTILVQQVVANFTFTPPSFTCSPTMTASYINQSSSNAVSFTWSATNYNGGSLSTSTLTNPTFTLVQGSLNPYTIYNTFGSVVTLTAQSAFGCSAVATATVYDSIRRPTAWFNKDKKEGCAPLVVKFRDSSFTNTTIYPITSYTWCNGATPPTYSVGVVPPPIVNPTFTYNTPGTYTPYLIIQTATGCIDTSFVDTITVVNPPTVSFNFSPTTVCWNQPVQIINTSPITTPAIQHWHVDSDNGFFSGCVNDPNPQWNFTHTGIHTFTLSGYLNSCKSSNTSTASVTVKGPIVRGRYETNCGVGTRKSVIFYSHLQDAQSATLNFGDGTPVHNITGTPGASASDIFTHVYAASGNYTATLTGFNATTGCSPNTFTMLVTVRDAVANFTMPAVSCASLAQTFNASSSIDVAIGCKRGYVWYFDNLPPRDTVSPNINWVFTTPGTHTVMLMVKDANSCGDTTKKTFRVSKASPTFSFSSNPICASNQTVNIFNTTSQTPDPITGYQWDFGDGSQSTTTASPFAHSYTATAPSQNYTITLIATNSIGCTDTIKQVLQVNNPIASLNASQYNICSGNTVTLTAPPGNVTYTFNTGVGSPVVLTTNTIAVSYTSSSQSSYTASVTVQDAGGCKNTSPLTTINVQSYPNASFSFISPNSTSTNNICAGSPVTFIDQSSPNPPTLNYNWNLGTGAAVINSGTVVNTYTAVGQVPISLTVSTSFGCTDTTIRILKIFGAKANLNLDKQVVCLGGAINFNVKDTSTVLAWVWDFGDGTTSPTITANPPPSSVMPHTYNFYPMPTGNTTVSLVYYSSQYACKYSATIPVQVVKIDADFDRNSEINKTDSVHCINIPDAFSNTTSGSSGFTFSWLFGDGGTSSIQNPTYTYPNSGVYQVTLTVTDPVNNCKGFAVRNMTINPLPNVAINSNDSVCQNAPFVLTGNTSPNVTTYSWSPSTGLGSPNSQTTTATTTLSPVQYSLAVTDVNGCQNATTKTIYVQLPPPNINWDTTVIIGQVTPLNGYGGINFNYSWTPTTDLNCGNCPYPISTSTNNITYSLTIEDGLGCFKTTNTFTIYVEPKATVDVPTAFTPNGDGTNDIINVAGWGIKKLNYFRVFNRWGQLLFESNDIKVGWDGLFNGVPQNMETYVYQVSVDTFVDKEALLKTGTFKLIR